MSHYGVLVCADDDRALEEVMLPYHEYECTGIEQYLEFVPTDLDEAKAKLAELQREHADVYGAMSFDEFVQDWYGAKQENGVWGRWTNPQAKWDWWVVGGRWHGMLITKDGQFCNEAAAGDVDWERMRQEQVDQATRRYDAVHQFGPLPDIDDKAVFRAWRKRAMDKDVHIFTRDEYNDLRNLSRDEWIEKYGTAKAITFAHIDTEGVWHQRAEMGWWGMTRNEQDGYDQQWWEFVRGLDDTQRVYVVDCHI